MKWAKHLVLLGLLGLGPPAIAEEGKEDPEESDASDAPDVADTVTGVRPPTLQSEIEVGVSSSFVGELASYQGRQYDPIVYYGARVLDLPPDFIHDSRASIDLLFKRDYEAANRAFAALAQKYRGYGLGPVGQVLVWQALMIENFDFRFESQYQTSYRKARQELEEAMARPGNEAWENFLLGGILGIDAIHSMRHDDYLVALNRGYEAMKAVNRSKEKAPEFLDMQLGDGLFNYWATVISMSSKLIPDLGDRREEGIAQMKTVERHGVFLGPPSSLALAFTWIEEGNYREALKTTMKNRTAYPNNVINNLVLGRVHMYLRDYKQSEAIFNEVVAYEPKNMRVHYYMGRLYGRWGKLDEADGAFDRYLSYDGVSQYDQAVAWYYKGNLAYRRKNWDQAEAHYKASWKLAHLEKAKDKLDRVKQKKKAAG